MHSKTHRVGVDVEEGGEVEDALEEGGEVHDILEEGREDVEEGGEVPKVPFMGLYSKLLRVPDPMSIVRQSRLSVNKRFRGFVQINSRNDFRGHVKCQIGDPLPKGAILAITRPFLRNFSMKEVVEYIHMNNFAKDNISPNPLPDSL